MNPKKANKFEKVLAERKGSEGERNKGKFEQFKWLEKGRKGELQTQVNATYFDFKFYDDEYWNAKTDSQYTSFSDKVVVSLDVNQLYWGYEYQDSLSSPYFEKKLRDSLVALFGKTTGTEIYKYVYEKYVRDFKSEDSRYYAQINDKETKLFGNMRKHLR